MRPSSPSQKKKQDENKGLRTERQIELHRQREKARREEAERREADAKAREAEARARVAEAQVRHLNFDLVERISLFGFAIAVGVFAAIGAHGDPVLLKVAASAGGVGGAAAAARYRWISKRSK